MVQAPPQRALGDRERPRDLGARQLLEIAQDERDLLFVRQTGNGLADACEQAAAVDLLVGRLRWSAEPLEEFCLVDAPPALAAQLVTRDVRRDAE